MGKLAPGSIFTDADQARWYRDQMGEAKLAEQIHLGNIAARRCSCDPVKVKRRWEGSEKLTLRTVHARSCAKFKRWMEEIR